MDAGVQGLGCGCPSSAAVPPQAGYRDTWDPVPLVERRPCCAGEFKQNVRTGRGVMEYAPGDRYEGVLSF